MYFSLFMFSFSKIHKERTKIVACQHPEMSELDLHRDVEDSDMKNMTEEKFSIVSFPQEFSYATSSISTDTVTDTEGKYKK